jgi:hydroxypyruvate reductase
LRERLIAVAREAVAACDGEGLCREALVSDARRTFVLAVGKAALAMARGAADVLDVHAGLAITKDEHHGGFAAARMSVLVAGHPRPDARSVAAADAAMRLLRRARQGDRVVVLISGGGSSLLASPLCGLSLARLAAANDAMLSDGLPIERINVVRKHITRASGGRLAQQCEADVEVLLLSDVLSDDVSAIASGPFAPDPSSVAEALAIAAGVRGMPDEVLALLDGDVPETPKPGDACFARVGHRIVASHATLRAAARAAARRQGFSQVHMLDPGERTMDACVEQLSAELATLAPGEIAIGGGEPVVTLPADHGLGGRNQQLALRVASLIAARPHMAFVAMASDGSDGPTDAAGAAVDDGSAAVMIEIGDLDRAIARADAYPLLDDTGLLLRSGPTGTNLLDLHLLAVG